MTMSREELLHIIGERLGRWAAQLEAMEATPVLLIAVTHGDPPQIQVFVPHKTAPELALMVEILHRAADALEAQGPTTTPPERRPDEPPALS